MSRILLLVILMFSIVACGSKKPEPEMGTLLGEAVIVEISHEKVKSLLASDEYRDSMGDGDYRLLADASGELELRPHRKMMDLDQVRSADNIVITMLMHDFDIGYVGGDYTKSYITPLHAAASAGRSGAVYMLLRSGWNPNEVNEFGGTPLMAAAYKCSLASMVILLDYGADPGVRDRSGQNVFDVAGMSGCDIASDVINNYVDGSPVDMGIMGKNKGRNR